MNETEKNATSGMDLLTLMHDAVKNIARAHHRRGHAHHAQQRVLSVLFHRPPPGSISQRELLEELGVRSASLSELLSKLERGGLIERKRDQADRRNFIIHLTAEGRAESSKHGDELGDYAEAIFKNFSTEEREQFGALLRKLYLSLEEFHFGPEHGPKRGPHGRRGGIFGHRHDERDPRFGGPWRGHHR